MLVKRICKKCFPRRWLSCDQKTKDTRKNLGLSDNWDDSDDRRWELGYVFCPNSPQPHQEVKKQSPPWCEYKMEHMIGNQKL